jgi:hypothetical protein
MVEVRGSSRAVATSRPSTRHAELRMALLHFASSLVTGTDQFKLAELLPSRSALCARLDGA